CGQGTDVPFTF
nr:immunoglobulin light chain junction region [Macaca mulatta]MOX54851.1 immunoglobulin light chain junction region [Macaca mulatta]